MSRDILITLAIGCTAHTCNGCRNYRHAHCEVFSKKPKRHPQAGPERLPECIEAEALAKGDWQAKLRVKGESDE